jgi:hypothetical protein
MRRIPFYIVLVALSLIVGACSGLGRDGGQTVTPTQPPVSPAATATTGSVAIPPATPSPTTNVMGDEPAAYSPPSLPLRAITFRVRVPAETPASDDVYVMFHGVDSMFTTDHVRLERKSATVFAGDVQVPDGGIIRYGYDRWDETVCCEAGLITREALFTNQPTGYRMAVIDPDMQVIEDVVPQWNDHRKEFSQVEVTGKIVDAATLTPLMDVDVTVAGVHVATAYDGTFTVPGIVPGPQTLVAYTVKGDYGTVQVQLEVGSGGQDVPDIRMSSAVLVPVEFEVHLPEGTPPDAGVFIAGNLWQLGARSASPNFPAIPSGISMPILEHDGDIARGVINLPVGANVQYYYTLGSDVAAEVVGAKRLLRSFVVDSRPVERVDSVSSWGNEGWPLTTLRVTVPSNTPEGVPVYLSNGPTDQMRQVGPFEWVTVIGSYPPGGVYRFGISLGDDMHGLDASPEVDESGSRSITIADVSSEISIVVSKWSALPDPTLRGPNGVLDVKFRLSVPPGTPSDSTIMITGDRSAVGAGGTMMRQVPGNPWLYEASITFEHDGDLHYRYTLVDYDATSREFMVNTAFHQQEVNDYLVSWDGSSPAERDGWISGIYTPDFWSESFLFESESTFKAATAANGDWVVISSVWNYGELLPLPLLESRPTRHWTVRTPIDDIRAQAAVALANGLKVFLTPHIHPENLPDWNNATVSSGSREWWENWLEEAEKQWMWNATVAEEIHAEMLILPGYVFHVFPPPGFFDDPEYVPEFDLKIQELIGRVRSVYSGKIMLAGGQRDYDFPGFADYIGVTTYAVGVPTLPADATFEDLQAYYASRFVEVVDPIYERWGKPVLFYTIHAPSKAAPGDPYGQLFQANAYEALFQQIAVRPEIAGAFSWSFEMTGAWEFETDGVRNRAAEAVLAKWYALLGG